MRAIIRDNLRNYYVISVIGFIAYMICIELPRLLGNIQFFLTCITNGSLFVIAISSVLAISAGLCVFRSSHDSKRAGAIGLLPIKRSKQFTANYISGLILILIPVIITTICIFAFHSLTINSETGWDELTMAPVGIKDMIPSIIGGWLIKTFVFQLFVYTSSVLAGAIAASTFCQGLITIVFNIGPFLCLYLTRVFVLNTWIGIPFDMEGNKLAATSLSPVSYLYVRGYDHVGYFVETTLSYYVITILMAALILLIAVNAYKKIDLSKCGKVFYFKSAGEICFIIIGILSMITVGGIIGMTSKIINMKILVAIICMIIALGVYLLCKGVSYHSFKEGIKHSKKGFIIVSCLSICFLAVFLFDVTGYSTKVPKAESVEMVSIGDTPNNDYSQTKFFRKKENINRVIRIQKSLIKIYHNDEVNKYSIDILYVIENDDLLVRSYSFNAKGNEEIVKDYNDLLNSTEAKEQDLDYFKQTKIDNINASFSMGVDQEKRIDKSKLSQLIEAVKKDYATHKISITDKRKNTIELYDDVDRKNFGLTFVVKSSDKNTIKFLKKYGYMKYFKLD